MKKGLVALAAIGLMAAPVQAQTNISEQVYFTPGANVQYLPFAVSVGGTFTLETFGTNEIDPYIRLFTNACNTGGCLGAHLASDDDSGTPSAPGFFWNSRLLAGLGAGNYTVAMSAYNFSEAEARSGVNGGFNEASDAGCAVGDWADCNFEMTIRSQDGRAVGVPEPTTTFLTASGLLALLGVARRRREGDLEV